MQGTHAQKNFNFTTNCTQVLALTTTPQNGTHANLDPTTCLIMNNGQWVKFAKLIKEMPQDIRRLAPKHHHGLKTSNLTLVGPKPVMVFTMFYVHYAKDHLPKSNSREKAAKWTNMAAKQVT